MKIKEIINEEGYKAAIKKVAELMEKEPCSQDTKEIERLGRLLENYIDKNNLVEMFDNNDDHEYPWEKTLKTFNH